LQGQVGYLGGISFVALSDWDKGNRVKTAVFGPERTDDAAIWRHSPAQPEGLHSGRRQVERRERLFVE
jgi:hypothetical protein